MGACLSNPCVQNVETDVVSLLKTLITTDATILKNAVVQLLNEETASSAQKTGILSALVGASSAIVATALTTPPVPASITAPVVAPASSPPVVAPPS